jgi:hypothetical protein
MATEKMLPGAVTIRYQDPMIFFVAAHLCNVVDPLQRCAILAPEKISVIENGVRTRQIGAF